MIRGTTPTLTFKIKTDLDFEDIEKAEITFKSENGLKERTWDENDLTIDPEKKEMYLQLTQEETLYFNAGKINIQLRLRMNNDMVYASNIVPYSLSCLLKEGVI